MPDVAPDVEAPGHDEREVEGDLAERDGQGRMGRGSRHQDLPNRERHRVVEPKEHPVDRRQPDADRRKVLVEEEGHGSMGEVVHQLCR